MDVPTNGPTLTVAPLVAALDPKLTDFVKYVVSAVRDCGDMDKRRDALNGVVTLLVSSVLGLLTVEFLLVNSAWADEITVGTQSLSALDTRSTLLLGIAFTALAGTLYDLEEALDTSEKTKANSLATRSGASLCPLTCETYQQVIYQRLR